MECLLAKQHAQAVARKLETSDGLIYLLGQYAFEIEDSDASKTWRQRRYFYYCRYGDHFLSSCTTAHADLTEPLAVLTCQTAA